MATRKKKKPEPVILLPPVNNSSIVSRKKKLYKNSRYVIGPDTIFFINRMKVLKGEGYFRETMFGHEVVWNERRYIFDDKKGLSAQEKKKKEQNRKHLFIFACVNRDAEKYIKKNKVKKTLWLPAVVHNEHFKKINDPICGTDIDGAYWRIAHQMGVISDRTYQHGIRINNKEMCLAALANMGSTKNWRKINKGEITGNLVRVLGNESLKTLYLLIRKACFSVMETLAKMLTEDFVVYKTDCIYYVKNERNVSMVTSFLEDHELDYKMMGPPGKTSLRKG